MIEYYTRTDRYIRNVQIKRESRKAVLSNDTEVIQNIKRAPPPTQTRTLQISYNPSLLVQPSATGAQRKDKPNLHPRNATPTCASHPNQLFQKPRAHGRVFLSVELANTALLFAFGTDKCRRRVCNSKLKPPKTLSLSLLAIHRIRATREVPDPPFAGGGFRCRSRRIPTSRASVMATPPKPCLPCIFIFRGLLSSQRLRWRSVHVDVHGACACIFVLQPLRLHPTPDVPVEIRVHRPW